MKYTGKKILNTHQFHRDKNYSLEQNVAAF